MEMKVNTDLIRQLRQARGLSQEELAMSAGLSLRTVQRVESEGIASLESKKALAGVFGINAVELDDKRQEQADARRALQQEVRRGMAGVAAGGLTAFVAIIYAMASGQSSGYEAGVASAIVAASCGACGTFIGVMSRRRAAHA